MFSYVFQCIPLYSYVFKCFPCFLMFSPAFLYFPLHPPFFLCFQMFSPVFLCFIPLFSYVHVSQITTQVVETSITSNTNSPQFHPDDHTQPTYVHHVTMLWLKNGNKYCCSWCYVGFHLFFNERLFAIAVSEKSKKVYFCYIQ